MINKKHLLAALFLYAITGVSACILYTNRDIIPVSIESPQSKSTILASPAAVSQTKADSTKETETDKTIESENIASNINDGSNQPEPSDTFDDNTYEQEYTYTASHNTGRLFIRDGASLDNKVLAFMNPGTTGDVISIDDEWVLLRYNDIEGYVYKRYLNLTEKK